MDTATRSTPGLSDKKQRAKAAVQSLVREHPSVAKQLKRKRKLGEDLRSDQPHRSKRSTAGSRSAQTTPGSIATAAVPPVDRDGAAAVRADGTTPTARGAVGYQEARGNAAGQNSGSALIEAASASPNNSLLSLTSPDRARSSVSAHSPRVVRSGPSAAVGDAPIFGSQSTGAEESADEQETEEMHALQAAADRAVMAAVAVAVDVADDSTVGSVAAGARGGLRRLMLAATRAVAGVRLRLGLARAAVLQQTTNKEDSVAQGDNLTSTADDDTGSSSPKRKNAKRPRKEAGHGLSSNSNVVAPFLPADASEWQLRLMPAEVQPVLTALTDARKAGTLVLESEIDGGWDSEAGGAAARMTISAADAKALSEAGGEQLVHALCRCLTATAGLAKHAHWALATVDSGGGKKSSGGKTNGHPPGKGRGKTGKGSTGGSAQTEGLGGGAAESDEARAVRRIAGRRRGQSGPQPAAAMQDSETAATRDSLSFGSEDVPLVDLVDEEEEEEEEEDDRAKEGEEGNRGHDGDDEIFAGTDGPGRTTHPVAGLAQAPDGSRVVLAPAASYFLPSLAAECWAWAAASPSTKASSGGKALAAPQPVLPSQEQWTASQAQSADSRDMLLAVDAAGCLARLLSWRAAPAAARDALTVSRLAEALTTALRSAVFPAWDPSLRDQAGGPPTGSTNGVDGAFVLEQRLPVVRARVAHLAEACAATLEVTRAMVERVKLGEGASMQLASLCAEGALAVVPGSTSGGSPRRGARGKKSRTSGSADDAGALCQGVQMHCLELIGCLMRQAGSSSHRLSIARDAAAVLQRAAEGGLAERRLRGRPLPSASRLGLDVSGGTAAVLGGGTVKGVSASTALIAVLVQAAATGGASTGAMDSAWALGDEGGDETGVGGDGAIVGTKRHRGWGRGRSAKAVEDEDNGSPVALGAGSPSKGRGASSSGGGPAPSGIARALAASDTHGLQQARRVATAIASHVISGALGGALAVSGRGGAGGTSGLASSSSLSSGGDVDWKWLASRTVDEMLALWGSPLAPGAEQVLRAVAGLLMGVLRGHLPNRARAAVVAQAAQGAAAGGRGRRALGATPEAAEAAAASAASPWCLDVLGTVLKHAMGLRVWAAGSGARLLPKDLVRSAVARCELSGIDGNAALDGSADTRRDGTRATNQALPQALLNAAEDAANAVLGKLSTSGSGVDTGSSNGQARMEAAQDPDQSASDGEKPQSRKLEAVTEELICKVAMAEGLAAMARAALAAYGHGGAALDSRRYWIAAWMHDAAGTADGIES